MAEFKTDANGRKLKKVRWYVKRRNSKSRIWKTKWVLVRVAPKPKAAAGASGAAGKATATAKAPAKPVAAAAPAVEKAEKPEKAEKAPKAPKKSEPKA